MGKNVFFFAWNSTFQAFVCLNGSAVLINRWLKSIGTIRHSTLTHSIDGSEFELHNRAPKLKTDPFFPSKTALILDIFAVFWRNDSTDFHAHWHKILPKLSQKAQERRSAVQKQQVWPRRSNLQKKKVFPLKLAPEVEIFTSFECKIQPFFVLDDTNEPPPCTKSAATISAARVRAKK